MMAVSNQPKIYVAGHQGMVGSAILRELTKGGYENLVFRTRSELDLTCQSAVQQFFDREKPDQVYLAAAKVGGIYANEAYPAGFIYQNLMIEANVIDSAFRSGVKKLLFLGSSCIYPKYAEQPISEEALLTGELEQTNESYAIAKIAGIKLCESYNRQYGKTHGIDYRCVMPCNLYGPGDNYHPENSHVIPALIRRFHEAKVNHVSKVTIWGSGKPKREFLYVDDLAQASVHIMNLEKDCFIRCVGRERCHINVGSGVELTIAELAEMIKEIVAYEGEIYFDSEKPDGVPRKLLDSGHALDLGWAPNRSLGQGIASAYQEFLVSRC